MARGVSRVRRWREGLQQLRSLSLQAGLVEVEETLEGIGPRQAGRAGCEERLLVPDEVQDHDRGRGGIRYLRQSRIQPPDEADAGLTPAGAWTERSTRGRPTRSSLGW